MSRFWTENEFRYLDRVWNKRTQKEIADALDRSQASVDRMIDKRYRKPLRDKQQRGACLAVQTALDFGDSTIKEVGRFVMEFNGRNWRQIGVR